RRAQRQQTLQAAMDWSWDLLSEDEQMCLRRLAVFSGTFTLEAAESVVAMPRTVDLIRSLVAKSLVNLEDVAATTRYRLLETVRLYAQERMVASGEAKERRDAHRDYYMGLFGSITWEAFVDLRVIADCLADYGNHRAALDWSDAQGDQDAVARLGWAVGATWIHSPALRDEAERWLRRVGEDEAQPPPVRADAYTDLATLAIVAGDLAAVVPLAEHAIELSDQGIAYGMALWALGRYDEAVVVARAADEPAMVRWCNAWAVGPQLAVDPSGALARYQEILAESDAERPAWDSWWALLGSVLARLLIEDAEAALGDARRLDSMLRTFASWGGSLFHYAGVPEAMALAQLGRFDDARAVLRDVAAATLRDHYPLMGTDCVIALGYIALRQGDLVGGAMLIELAIRDGRFRCQPLYFFVGRILHELRIRSEGVDLQTPLPTVHEYIDKIRRIMADEEPRDPVLTATLEAVLEDFVANAGR
ncbi:MAG: hypothetical protein QOH00_1688, partial [Gaiellales bacterium]|nr:hypothetical protein [Gaiellales bacterium]